MAYAPLFHEIHSEIFLALCKIINKVHQGAKMTRSDIMKELSFYSWSSRERADELIDTLFLFQEDGYAILFLDKPIHYRPSTAELVWLRMMLEDKRVAFLLPGALKQKLEAMLSNVSSWHLDDIWKIKQEQGDDASILQSKLTAIWQALHQKKKIYYRNRDRRGNIHEGNCAPCRLEYDAAANRYRLIIWQDEEQRAIKINISSLQEVRVLDEIISESTEKAFQDFLQSRRCAVRIEVSKKIML